jgi:hypothetical protein
MALATHAAPHAATAGGCLPHAALTLLSISSFHRPQLWPLMFSQVWARPVAAPHSQQNDCRAPGNSRASEQPQPIEFTQNLADDGFLASQHQVSCSRSSSCCCPRPREVHHFALHSPPPKSTQCAWCQPCCPHHTASTPTWPQGQVTWLQPPFFSTGLWQLGQGLVLAVTQLAVSLSPCSFSIHMRAISQVQGEWGFSRHLKQKVCPHLHSGSCQGSLSTCRGRGE